MAMAVLCRSIRYGGKMRVSPQPLRWLECAIPAQALSFNTWSPAGDDFVGGCGTFRGQGFLGGSEELDGEP